MKNREEKKIIGNVQLRTWTDDPIFRGKKDQSIQAILRGGNVGHAALMLNIPLSQIEQDSELDAKIREFREMLGGEQARIVFTDDQQVNFRIGENQVVSVPTLQIYFSFWPEDEDHPRYMLETPEGDMKNEWTGRQTDPIDKNTAARVFFHSNLTDEEIAHLSKEDTEKVKGQVREYRQRSSSETERSMMNPVRFLKRFQTKTVESGPKVIIHNIDGPRMLEDIKNAYHIVKSNETYMELLKEYPPFLNVQNKIAGLELYLSKSDDEVEKGWNNNSLRQLSAMFDGFNKSLKLIKNDKSLSEEQRQQLKALRTKFQDYKKKVDNKENLTMGIPPTITTIEADNFDLKKLITGMEKMLEKKWQFRNWNCSSTVLYIMLTSLNKEFQEDPKIRKIIKKLAKKHPKIFTPKKAEKTGGLIQETIVKRKLTRAKREDVEDVDVQEKSNEKGKEKINDVVQEKFLDENVAQ